MVLWAARCPSCPIGSSRHAVAGDARGPRYPTAGTEHACWRCGASFRVDAGTAWVSTLQLAPAAQAATGVERSTE